MTWVEMLPSIRARWLRRLAQLVSFAAALACLAIAWRAPQTAAVIAAVVSVAAAAWSLRSVSKPWASAITVDPGGTIWLRRGDTAAAAAPRYFSRGYVALKSGQVSLSLWCDALPPAAWRRLQVACRWPSTRPPEGKTTGLRPPPIEPNDAN